jgi:hypothetical protein
MTSNEVIYQTKAPNLVLASSYQCMGIDLIPLIGRKLILKCRRADMRSNYSCVNFIHLNVPDVEPSTGYFYRKVVTSFLLLCVTKL